MSRIDATSLDSMLTGIVSRAAADITHLVRQSIAVEVSRLVGGSARDLTALGRVRQRRVIACPVPSCGKAGGGPRWGWFCAEHRNLPEAEKEKARLETRPRPLVARAMAERRRRAAAALPVLSGAARSRTAPTPQA
jgi:hypothetical protein